MMATSAFLLMFLVLPSVTYGANILFYQAFGSVSHQNIFYPLANALHDKGHKVTAIMSVPTQQKFEVLSPPSISDSTLKILQSMNVVDDRLSGRLIYASYMPVIKAETVCRAFLNSPEMKNISTGKAKFDLLIIDPLANECGLALGHIYNISVIYFATAELYPWQYQTFGLGISSAYMEITPLLKGTADIGHFYSRFCSVLGHIFRESYRSYISFPAIQSLWEEHLGKKIPSLHEIESNVSLVLLNSDPTVRFPIPFLSNMIDVGGIHLKEQKSLPKNVEELLKNAGENGFILFSFGSIAQSNQLPQKFVDEYLSAFRRLPITVLWKFDKNPKEMKNIPKNVIIEKWLPQANLLAHPKCRGFITHGGRLSLLESVYFAVPIIIVPFFADQETHARIAENSGYGIYLELEDSTEQSVYDAVNEILTNPKYRKNAAKKSALLKDQSQSPLEKAVYWTEYVLRHKDLSHMQPAARHWTFFTFYLLDVWLTIIFIIILIILLPFFFIRTILRLLFCSKNNKNDSDTVRRKKMKKK